jgi:hypothetical protein
MEEWVNSTISEATGFTPAELMTGEQPVSIFEQLLPPRPDTTPNTVTYEEKALQAYARMRLRANRRSRRRKRGLVKWIPRLQEAVLLRTHQSDMAKGVTSKFQRPYEGPYYVTRIVNPSIYEISDARGKSKGIFNKGSSRRFR